MCVHDAPHQLRDRDAEALGFLAQEGELGVGERYDLLLHTGSIPRDAYVNPVVFNIGCGPVRIEGAIGVDLHAVGGVDVQADILALPFRDGVADRIVADHVLEHVDQRLTFAVLREAGRVLRPGGAIEVGVPDLADYCRHWLEAGSDVMTKADLLRGIYGGQFHAGEYHRSGWDAALLTDVLATAGFTDVSIGADDGPWRMEGFCIKATGVKA